MPRYRHALPQLDDAIFLTDGGLETHLVFQEGLELPCFAAFPLLASEEGRACLARYFAPYLRTAREHGVGFILDTPTWRASADWGARLGCTPEALARTNRDAAAFAVALRDDAENARIPVVVAGALGPRGDGYRADARASAADAQAYHAAQIETFAETEVDMVSGVTLTYAEEAIGIARAAKAAGLPSAISFTVETDGRLPSGMTIPDAIEAVDAATAEAPAYYMINCAHPAHFAEALTAPGAWHARLRGLRANASTRSHAELDAATEIDAGDPADLGARYRALRGALPGITVLGGCCGTDARHVRAICEACLPG
jgi:homocysteine S-methyltransferase